uniref:Uncharacterized protein LOC117345721 isoform X3 n=1 Tax=Geotrypetes seraphini TaxID=260995 RepID=A0A6P8P5G5_GEOSA|nr:uncharacterized protein LOC117345721 isoform X3 [Geotrypetes seraphini]
MEPTFVMISRNPSNQTKDASNKTVTGYQSGEISTPGIYLQSFLSRTHRPQLSVTPLPIGALTLQYEKNTRLPGGNDHQHPVNDHFQRGWGCIGSSWDSRRDDHIARYSQEFAHSNQCEVPVWDHHSDHTNVKAVSLTTGLYHSASSKNVLTHQITNPYSGDLDNPGGDFPLFVWGLPQTASFLIPTEINKGGTEAPIRHTAPNICTLALAMLIAGIPTVPVPGVKEEDMIMAAQLFMMENPELATGSEVNKRRSESLLREGHLPST